MASKLMVGAVFVLLVAFWIYRQPVPPGCSQPLKLKLLQASYRLSWKVGALLEILGIAWQRNVIRKGLDASKSLSPSYENIKVTDTKFDGVKVRIYDPQNRNRMSPGLVYYHGGGWTVGSVDAFHGYVLRLTEALGMFVVSVDYRSCPEHSAADGLEDSYLATVYFLQHSKEFGVDPLRIAVIGDSAGANFATNIAIALRDKKPKDKAGTPLPSPAVQILVYPAVQMVDMQLPSYQQNENAPVLPTEDMYWFVSHVLVGNASMIPYLKTGSHVTKEVRVSMAKDRLNHDLIPLDQTFAPYQPPKFQDGDGSIWDAIKDKVLSVGLSPLLAESHQNLPPAYIYTCQYDPVRDDGFLYARRLKESGVEVVHYNDPNGFHANLLYLGLLEDSEEPFRKMIEYIQNKL